MNTAETRFFFNKIGRNFEKTNARKIVAESQLSSKVSRNKNCPPATVCLNSKARGTQMLIQNIQKAPLKKVNRNIFVKEKIAPSLSPILSIFQTWLASQKSRIAPASEMKINLRNIPRKNRQ
ncbi:hypothetical protein HZA42_03405 [Candidatus Peregrinibacteria bacterium]|nr:hypothetical protein [Candidatus Peregrinibacteria bacterium]